MGGPASNSLRETVVETISELQKLLEEKIALFNQTNCPKKAATTYLQIRDLRNRIADLRQCVDDE